MAVKESAQPAKGEDKEVERMKNHWLQGVLLGVSLALLLAGGVALAQGLTLTVDQDCFECWPNFAAGPDEEHTVVVTLDDYDDELDLCRSLEFNPELIWELGCIPAENLPEPPSCELSMWVDCEYMGLYMEHTCWAPGPRAGWPAEAGTAVVPVVEYGDWVLRVWQDQEEPVEVAFTFAEVCEVPVEFVPEPGTIALLGSGLAGLAGYAALRWRARS
jgi:hypothetical protein